MKVFKFKLFPVLFVFSLILVACQKEKNQNETNSPNQNISTETNHLALIKSFLSKEQKYQMQKRDLTKQSDTFELCNDCLLTLDSIDYYFSNGLNYLFSDAKNDYSDFRVDESTFTPIELPVSESTNYEYAIEIFNVLKNDACQKFESLEAEGEGWNIHSIEMVMLPNDANNTLLLSLKYNLGQRIGIPIKASFSVNDCYNWNYGSCSNINAQSIRVSRPLANKIMANYSWGTFTPLNGRKVLLTDNSNKTEGLKIFPQWYDTYTNPYGNPSQSPPTIKPTEIFSFAYASGSNPSILLNQGELNYYLDKGVPIIFDFDNNFRPAGPYSGNEWLIQWAKLNPQHELLSLVVKPFSDGACPDARRNSGLDVCYSHRHVYEPTFCNFIIVNGLPPECQ